MIKSYDNRIVLPGPKEIGRASGQAKITDQYQRIEPQKKGDKEYGRAFTTDEGSNY
jgi:hypothetical protein